MNLRMCLLLVLGFMVSQGSENTRKKDLDAMQGNWKLAWYERDGKKSVVECGVDIIRTIKGNKWVSNGVEVFAIEIDPTCDPKLLDLTLLTGDGKGTKGEGIYKIDGDTMVWCYFGGDGIKQRPLEFRTKEGSGLLAVGLTRHK